MLDSLLSKEEASRWGLVQTEYNLVQPLGAKVRGEKSQVLQYCMQPSGVHLGNFKKLSVTAPYSKSVQCNSSQYEGKADTPHFIKLIPTEDIFRL